MTKRKSIVSKVLLAIVALTLISCCFLGSTFARYTSGGTGAATTTVSKWDISLTADGESSTDFDIEIAGLSPSKAEYDDADAEPTDRTNATARTLIAVISNKGDVGAKITLPDANTLSATITTDGASYGTGLSYGDQEEAPSEGEVARLFSVDFYYYEGTTSTPKSANLVESGTNITLDAKDSNSIYLYAEVTWTSQDSYYYGVTSSNHAAAEWYADALDTWAGEHVTTVTYSYTVTAVQNTEVPQA